MSNPFDILVYLDENLVKNLASLVLTGYIETITLTQAFDRTLKAGMKEENIRQSAVLNVIQSRRFILHSVR